MQKDKQNQPQAIRVEDRTRDPLVESRMLRLGAQERGGGAKKYTGEINMAVGQNSQYRGHLE